MDVELIARKEPGSEETPPDVTCTPVSFLNWQLCNDQKSHRRSTVSHTYTSIFRQTQSSPINFFLSCIYHTGASYIFLLTGLPHASLIELYAAQAASTIRSFLICFLVHEDVSLQKLSQSFLEPASHDFLSFFYTSILNIDDRPTSHRRPEVTYPSPPLRYLLP